MYDLYFSWSTFSSSQFYLVVQNIIRHLYNAHIMKIHSLEQLPTKYNEFVYGFLIMHVDGNREVWVFKNENMPLMRQYST